MDAAILWLTGAHQIPTWNTAALIWRSQSLKAAGRSGVKQRWIGQVKGPEISRDNGPDLSYDTVRRPGQRARVTRLVWTPTPLPKHKYRHPWTWTWVRRKQAAGFWFITSTLSEIKLNFFWTNRLWFSLVLCEKHKMFPNQTCVFWLVTSGSVCVLKRWTSWSVC